MLRNFLLAFLSFTMLYAETNDFKPREIIPIYKGQNHISFHNTLKGYDFIDYTFEAKAGQSATIVLRSGNRFNFFNVLAPEEEGALFVGSLLGDRFDAILPKHGMYTIRVYLMRNAARRGEKAEFMLEVKRSENIAPQVIDPLLGPVYYDASGTIQCSIKNPTLEHECEFKVIRTLQSSKADIWIKPKHPSLQDDAYRFIHFDAKEFSTDSHTKVSQERNDDNWLIDINKEEFYLIPDALLYGG